VSFPYLDARRPRAFAHRGCAEGCAENSFEAVARAVEMGLGYVETDVQATRDGVAVLFHDDTTDRLLGTPGRIADRDWADWARTGLAGGGGLARLDTVLDAFPGLRLNIDAKTDDVVGPMARAIADARATDRVCAASFDIRRTRALRERLGPRLCWSPAMGGVAALWAWGWGVAAPGETAPCYQVPLRWKGIPLVTRRVVAAAHARGAEIHVWTVDDPAEMTRLLDLGVDGLMTDRPRILIDALSRRGAWHRKPQG